MRHRDGDKAASIAEVQSLSGRSWCRCGADERGGGCALPGETSFTARRATVAERRREGERGVSRGHRFCRYADDCNVYVKSARAGERVMGSLKALLTGKLKLKVSETKSSVTRPWAAKFLGYSMTVHRQPRLKVAARSVERFIEKDLNPVVRGWANYYRKAMTYGVFEDLDGWLRRKLRCLIWRRWKRV